MALQVTLQKEIVITVLPSGNITSGGKANIFYISFSIDLIIEISRFRQFQIISYELFWDLIHINTGQEKLPDEVHTAHFVRGFFRTQKNTLRLNVQLVESKIQRLIRAENFENVIDHLMVRQEDLLLNTLELLSRNN